MYEVKLHLTEAECAVIVGALEYLDNQRAYLPDGPYANSDFCHNDVWRETVTDASIDAVNLVHLCNKIRRQE